MKRIPQSSESVKGELIGYARVSTDEQRLDLQIEALKNAGCYAIYQEKLGATSRKRVELDRLIRDLREGDTLVVWRLDRLARSIRDLLTRLEAIEQAGAKFRSLTENFDTVTAVGRLIMHVVAAMAEFERQLTVERTIAGMAEARKRGVQIGQKLIFDPAMKAKVIKLWTAKDRKGKWKYTTAEVATKLDISTSLINNRLPGGREAYMPKRKRTR
jgi:DNA invertase Pin-like site-specific DNA recombinase